MAENYNPLGIVLFAVLCVVVGIYSIVTSSFFGGLLLVIVGTVIALWNNQMRGSIFAVGSWIMDKFFKKESAPPIVQKPIMKDSPGGSQQTIGVVHGDVNITHSAVSPENELAPEFTSTKEEKPLEVMPKKELDWIVESLNDPEKGTRIIGVNKLILTHSKYQFPKPKKLVEALVKLLKEDRDTQFKVFNALDILVRKKEARKTVVDIAFKPVSELVTPLMYMDNLSLVCSFLFDTESDKVIPIILQCFIIAPKERYSSLKTVFYPNEKNKDFLHNLTKELTKFQKDKDETLKQVIIDIVTQLNMSGPPY